MASVLVPLAAGCEELEAVTVVDLLRRAGVHVVTAGLSAGSVRGAHDIVLVPDMVLDEALNAHYDMIVLPGGLPGADHMDRDPRIRAALVQMDDGGKYLAAICAAPKVLASAGLLRGRVATSYPGVLDRMNVPGLHFSHAAVVVDGQVITSRGPGTAMDFALQLIESLVGRERRDQVAHGLARDLPQRVPSEDIVD